MKKLLFLFCICINLSYAQQTNWTINPLSDLGFTENLNQFENILEEKVQYFAEFGSHKIFFSKDAFIFGRQEDLSKEERSERYEKIEHGESVAPLKWNYFKMKFYQANKDVLITALEIKKHTRNFKDPNNPRVTIKARDYGRLIYENIYPNIDMELELPNEGGFKYSFIVHAGGDPKQIKINYFGVDVEMNKDGSLALESFIPFIDKAPKS